MSIEILIIEDNPRKLETTERYLNNISSDINITVVTCIIDAKRAVKDKYFDGIVIDMQLPMRNNSSIERKGGVLILQDLDLHDIKSPRCVNTSAEDTRDTLKEAGYEAEQCIINNSMYNCTSSFIKFLERVTEYKSTLAAEYATAFATIDVNNNVVDVSTTMLEAIVVESEQIKDIGLDNE